MEDKQAVKTAVKILVNNPLVKGEAAKVFVEGLENDEISATDWLDFFESEGVTSELSKSIYNVNMLRGLFLRAIAIPQTLQEFFLWLKTLPKNQKSLNYIELALKFQNDLAAHLSEDDLQLIGERLSKGIYGLLHQLLEKKITPKQCIELLKIADYIFEDFINNFTTALENIIQKISKRHKYMVLSQITSEKEVWQPLDYYYQEKLNQQPYYQPFGELFTLLQKYNLAAYFTQVSKGKVPSSLYNQAKLETPNLWEVKIKRKVDLINPVTIMIFLLSIGIPLFRDLESAKIVNKQTIKKPPALASQQSPPIKVQKSPQETTTTSNPEVANFETTKNSIKNLLQSPDIRSIFQANRNLSPEEIDSQMLILVMFSLNNINLRISTITSALAEENDKRTWIETIKKFQTDYQLMNNPNGLILPDDATYNKLKDIMLANAKQLV